MKKIFSKIKDKLAVKPDYEADFEGDESEDHLGAALWNIMCMIQMRDEKPELDDRQEFC